MAIKFLVPTKDIPYSYGRHVEHDERSRAIAYTPPPKLVERSVQWTNNAAVLDQLNTSSCTGHAMAQMFNCEFFKPLRKAKNNGRYFVETDALRLYSRATQLDDLPGDYPPFDSGSSGLGVAKAAKQFGYIDSYKHTFSFDTFRAAVQSQPVIVGTYWTQAMLTPNKGLVRPGPLTNGNIIGGHEYVCRGIDYKSRLFTFRNSWGKSWGMGGEFWMTFDDFKTLLAADGDCTVPHGVLVP